MKTGVFICAAVLAAALGAVALGVLYFFEPGAGYEFFPKCRFYEATGLLCPGCGTTRALHQLLHGNVGAAFYYNCLFVSAVPLGALIGITWWCGWRGRAISDAWRWKMSIVAGFGTVAVLVAFWIIRNLPGWPLM